MALTSEQRSRLPARVWRAPKPPTIADQAAHAKLNALLADAVRDLARLTADPIVIAASPNRFNDIYWSDWRAVRFGSFFTERHDWGDPPEKYEAALADGPSGARTARDVLESLESAAWRDLFSSAFALPLSDQALALVLQDGIPWLVFSASNNTDENFVFSLWDDEPIAYFGECVDRFDWTMRHSPPLRFQETAPFAGS